ncbi:MAG: argininosuccinate synthase [Gaiellales bacterium]|nr:argininosuccinate synthase [Gaiellales bacterium]
MASELCILAYSGGLDTSALVPYIKETYGYDVIAVLVDAGRNRNLAELKQRALGAGAVDAVIIDAREEFARDFVLPALLANTLYEDKYPLVAALSRPLIAKKIIDLAHERGAKVVAHGCTAKGNDQVRFDISFRCLDPTIRVMGPAREWGMNREEILDYCAARNINVPLTKKNPYSVDENLWGRTIECGELEDAWAPVPEGAFTETVNPKDGPDEPQEVVVTFEMGVPVAVDGVKMPLVELIDAMDKIAGKHGYGRVDMIENRLVGIKSREIYEVPGALALIMAHKDLEDLVMTRDLLRYKSGVDTRMADMIYDAQWFSPLADALRAFVNETQKWVSGDVRLSFFKGNCTVVGRRSPNSLYVESLATYATGDEFSHESAVGFIQLWGLPMEVAARRAQGLL